MQEYLGMAHPCCGAIFGATVQRGRGRYEASRLWRPGVECEIAVQLRRALRPLAGGRPHTRQSVGGAVGSVTAAIELVDDRYQDFERRVPDWPVWVADGELRPDCRQRPLSQSLGGPPMPTR
jgi:2-keto-4-pentenoate hydratase